MKKFISFSLFVTILISVFSLVSYAYNIIPLDINFPEKRVIKVLHNDEESPTPTPGFLCNTMVPEPTPTQGCTYLPIYGEYGVLSYEIRDSKVKILSCDKSAAGEIDIPNEIEGYPVTELADWLFSYFKEISKIKIPANVSSIGENVFFDCNGLNKIEVDESNRYFSSENGVLFNKDKTELIQYPASAAGTSYVVPDTVVKIHNSGFRASGNLQIVTIGENVEKIDSLAFENSGIINVIIPDKVKYIGSRAFGYCNNLSDVKIGSGLKELLVGGIETNTFLRCGKLSNIEVNAENEKFSSEDGVLFNKSKTELIQYPVGKTDVEYIVPEGVIIIGDYSFLSCANLNNIKMQKGLKNIEEGAFKECISLDNVEIPKGVTYIGVHAFHSCGGLTRIVIPETVIKIDIDAFKGCSNLTIYGISDSYAEGYANENSIDFSVLEEFIVENGVLTEYNGFGGDIVIPGDKGITSIGNYVFYNNQSITSVIISEGIGNIGESAFGLCSNLTHISLPDTLWKIQPLAFAGSGLTTVTIPPKCSIYMYAFRACNNLNEVVFKEGVSELDADIFEGCNSLKTIILPTTIKNIDLPFKGCDNLSEIILSDGTSKVLSGIFSKCSAIKRVYIPDSAAEIESGAFTDCELLEAIVVPNSVTQIGENVISNCDKAVIYSQPYAYAREYAEANNIPWADIKTLNGGWNWETSIEKSEDKENTYICTAKNVSAGKKTGEFIAAYYDGFGNMLGNEIKSLNRNSGEKETICITIPNNDMSKVKTIKAFVWDSFANMNAVSQYAECIINN